MDNTKNTWVLVAAFQTEHVSCMCFRRERDILFLRNNLYISGRAVYSYDGYGLDIIDTNRGERRAYWLVAMARKHGVIQ